MGKPMAHNLLKAGYALTVHNRSRPAVEELVKAGASDGASPRGVAQRSDIVITMLPDSPDVQQVVLASGGVPGGLRPATVLVGMSTNSPLRTQEVCEAVRGQGAQMPGGPGSGGRTGG